MDRGGKIEVCGNPVLLNRSKMADDIKAARQELRTALYECVEKGNKMGCDQHLIAGMEKLDGKFLSITNDTIYEQYTHVQLWPVYLSKVKWRIHFCRRAFICSCAGKAS